MKVTIPLFDMSSSIRSHLFTRRDLVMLANGGFQNQNIQMALSDGRVRDIGIWKSALLDEQDHICLIGDITDSDTIQKLQSGARFEWVGSLLNLENGKH